MQRRPLVLPARKPPRRRLAIFNPDWDKASPYRLYAIKYVERHYWRVQHVLLDKEDALAECAMIFAVCKRAYYGRVFEPKHFMALYKTALNNKWHKHARTDERYRSVIDASVDPFVTWETETGLEGNAHLSHFLQEDPIGPLAVGMSELPPEIQLVLTRLVEAPSELINALFHPPGNKPKPDPHTWAKQLDLYLHEIFHVPYPMKGKRRMTFDFIERIRGLLSS